MSLPQPMSMVAFLPELELLLRDAIGLDSASLGAGTVATAVLQRHKACGLDAQGYLDVLRSSSTELQELVESLVVPETWFVRDEAAFELLAKTVHVWRQRVCGARPLRLLSLPCATGEEPYSMALTLLEWGFAPEDFHIDALDISARALARAAQGVYGAHSFRGRDSNFRDRHFASTARGYRISDVARKSVHLQQGNIFSPGLSLPKASYDVIFCRNMLIYFEATMQRRALDVLTGLLSKGGWLFVGPAETPLVQGVKGLSPRGGRAFVLSDAAEAPLAAEVVRQRPVKPRQVRLAQGFVPFQRPAGPLAVKPSPAPPAAPRPELSRASQWADEGRFGEAAAECERFLQSQGPAAEAYHLLGLIADAQGKADQAAGCYRKALYLEPGHAQALIHLACLLEEKGEHASAQLLRRRAALRHEGKP